MIKFMPHRFCFNEEPLLVLALIIAHGITAISYFSIPGMLVYLAKKRPDIPLRGQFWLFGAFILLCGTGHALAIVDLYKGWYYLSTSIHVLTGIVSMFTALAFWPAVKIALRLPSPKQLKEANERLAHKVRQNATLQAENDYLKDMLIKHGIDTTTSK